MRRSFPPVVLMITVLSSAFSSASAQAPLPAEKPVQEMGEGGFEEGVDLPRAKPAPSPERKTGRSDWEDGRGKQPDAVPVSCQIEGAVFEMIQPVSGNPDGSRSEETSCGISEPVLLESVMWGERRARFPGEVKLSCGFARKLVEWLKVDVLPVAEERLGSPIAVIGSGPGYQCRRRNNRPDGKVSEHAKGRAIDLPYFKLADGSVVSVEKDWGTETEKGGFLKSVHTAACKHFTTVLGPEADADHTSHFHLDIGCHGKDCTYLICQ